MNPLDEDYKPVELKEFPSETNIVSEIFKTIKENTWIQNAISTQSSPIHSHEEIKYGVCLIGAAKATFTGLKHVTKDAINYTYEFGGWGNLCALFGLDYITETARAWCSIPKQYRWRVTAALNKVICTEYPEMIENYNKVLESNKLRGQALDYCLLAYGFNDNSNTNYGDIELIFSKAEMIYAEKYL